MLRHLVVLIGIGFLIAPISLYGEDPWAALAKQSPDAPPEPLEEPEDALRSKLSKVASKGIAPYTDTFGFKWQFNGAGALMRNDQGLREGFVTSINGKAMQLLHRPLLPLPPTGESAPRVALEVEGSSEGIRMKRRILVDRERGAVCFQDLFENASEEDFEGKLVYKTQTDRDFTSASTNLGRPLTGRLEEDEIGALFQQAPDSGKGSLFILASDGVLSSERPRAEFALSGDSEIEITYSLNIPAQSRVALFHWLGLKHVMPGTAVQEVFDPFFKRRKLYHAYFAPGIAPFLSNFSVQAQQITPNSGQLQALDQVCARLEVERGQDDLLWLNETSVLAGKITGSPMTLETEFGEAELKLDDLAGLAGGAARGLPARAYFRDGSLLIGQLKSAELKLEGSEGWVIDLDPASLQHLFTGVAQTDGQPPENATHMLSLRSGSMLPVTLQKGSKISLATPWGMLKTSANQLNSIELDDSNALQLFVEHRDGTRLQAFPSGGQLMAKSSRLGPLKIPLTELVGMRPLSSRPAAKEDAPEPSRIELQGGNYLTGKIALPAITFVSDTATTSITTSEIAFLSRNSEDAGGVPTFECELAGGETLIGTILENPLPIKDGRDQDWNFPLRQIVEYRGGSN